MAGLATTANVNRQARAPDTQSGFETFRPLTRSATVPVQGPSPVSPPSAGLAAQRLDRSHLAPEDAFLAASPPRGEQHRSVFPPYDGSGSTRQRSSNEGSRSRSRPHRHRHGKRSTWKKLLWVKQSYPDNYTDQATFLENLQRNPRLQPYEFWTLVADSTVIVQHVCSVIIFIVCFASISVKRVSPISMVSWSSLGTFVGWLLWDRWVSAEMEVTEKLGNGAGPVVGITRARAGTLGRRTGSIRRPPVQMPLPTAPSSMASTAASSTTNLSAAHLPAARRSVTSLHSGVSSSSYPYQTRSSIDLPSATPYRPMSPDTRDGSFPLPPSDDPTTSHAHHRIGTFKSAMLIFSTLLGLSPILKSLTRSTSSDSIWAMSFWLLLVNIFSFDYSTSDTTRVPASLSTNAALMASTVLASRLPSTGQVFSLTLFSIEVFGLFPIFRRAVRQQPGPYHYAMTALLVLGAGGGVGIVAGDTGEGPFPWRRCVAGMVVGVLTSAIAMGGCSWWLIGLQKYKNEIYGPWDPARPIIMSRRFFDD